MKKLLQLFTLFIFCTGGLLAQTPMFFNTNVVSGANAFPLGSTTSSKVQWCIPAGSLGTVTAGNNITKVYFQSGGAYSNTYPNLNIRLKTGTSAGLTGTASGPWESGMTLVYAGTAVPLVTTSGQWFGFTLTTPWLYNPALPLFVEMEQNGTSASQTCCQAVNIAGSGNGRQWGLYGSTAITSTGLNQVNFGIDVLPATPCTAPPSPNSVLPVTFTTCPGISNPTVGLANTYTFGGITYQWLSSTTSSVGPFTPINGATLSTITAPTLATTTWFQAVATCTNPGGGSTSLTPNQFFVAGTVTNTIPYNEGFEALQMADRLPNCSWWANGLGTTVKTYTSAGTSNRIARNGSSFATFAAPTTLTNNTLYSNGIWLDPGVTYSATIWYQTDLVGSTNWTNLSLSVGTGQASNTQTLIATNPGAAVSLIYKPLTGTFTVGSSGLYYIETKVNGASAGAPYIMLDDLSITAPCSLNAPAMNAVANNTNICQGSAVVITATGANSYYWNTGATTNTMSNLPVSSTVYNVIGTSSLTGCTSTVYVNVNVNPSPAVFAMATSPFVCMGSVATLMASGANSFQWSNSTSGAVAYVTPSVNTTYTVVGVNPNGCANSAVVTVSVRTLPNVNTAVSSNVVCTGEKIDLIASGANSYQWTSNANSQMYVGSQVSIVIGNSGAYTFTVNGTDNNGCSSAKTVSVTVNPCTGIGEVNFNTTSIKVFPNPATETLFVESNTAKISSISLQDISGRIIAIYTPDNKSTSININALAKGVYFLKVGTSENSELIKFIRE